MKTPFSYIPSKTLPGDGELLRQHGFTRWMSLDLMQAATDFCKNLGLVAIYAETTPDHLTRYIFWRPPQGARFEIRTGRTEPQFREFDQANITKGWPLLTLHINENDVHSAVWISAEHLAEAKSVLEAYGISPALRKQGE